MLITVDAGNTKSAEVLALELDRDRELNNGTIWNDKLWHTDAAFSSQLTAFLAAYREGLLAQDAVVSIRAKDNSVNELTRVQILQLAGTVMAYVQDVYRRSWRRKDALQ